jgi:zinc protease
VKSGARVVVHNSVCGEQLLPVMYRIASMQTYAYRLNRCDQQFQARRNAAYYHKWYRPDLQGIIVVGDVNVDEMEKQIKDLFSPIKLDENRAERIYYPVPDNKEPIVALLLIPKQGRHK